MKTKYTVIASVVLFVASTIATMPANAQRRTTTTVVKERNEQESKANENKSEDKKEGSSIKNRKEPATGRRITGKEPATAQKKSYPVTNERKSSAQVKRATQQSAAPTRQEPSAIQRKPANARQAAARPVPAQPGRTSDRYTGAIRNSSVNGGPVNARARAEHNRNLYRLDSKDNRYIPAKNFKGNKNSWTVKQASYHAHYSKKDANFYSHYDHRKYKHWDSSWEHYKWNVNSWREYYYGYHPQSYRFHKHYFYHPGYGHVIKKFTYKPVFFVHNNIRYYNYNGHFFRHFKGLGYVLTDMPYGLTVHKLPTGAERVYINGYLYFRVGNLFFETNPSGFALIHYPERYYALDNNFYNGGYYRSVDFSIRY